MKIIDISWPISQDMTAYKNRKVVRFERTKKFDTDNVRGSVITLDSHSGTHVDAPAHFLKDGKTIDQIGLDNLIGAARVLDCIAAGETITQEFLMQYDTHIKKHDIILLKTTNSILSPVDEFNTTFTYLEVSGARYLANKKVKAVGIDYLGIERNQPGHETHCTLMDHNIAIIEGLRLEHVQPGEYQLYCLPLKIMGLEAAPARAILVR